MVQAQLRQTDQERQLYMRLQHRGTGVCCSACCKRQGPEVQVHAQQRGGCCCMPLQRLAVCRAWHCCWINDCRY